MARRWTYTVKHKLFPYLLPVIVPTVGVPISMATAYGFHAVQGARLFWLHRRNRRSTPTRPPAGSCTGVRSQAEAMSRLPLDDYRPRNMDGYTSTALRSLPDLAPMYFDSGIRFRGRFYRYPRHFHETLIPTKDGATISAVMGLHHAKQRRPGLIIVHGLLNTKGQDIVRVVTQRAFYEWGFNVVAIDLRGFGRSAESVSVPSGAGLVDAEDILEVARYMRQFRHFTSIGVMGFSLGGGAALNMAALPESADLIDGGVLAVSPPLNFEACVKRFELPPEDEEHLLNYHFFQLLLRRMLGKSELMRWAKRKIHEEGGDPNVENFMGFMRNIVAWGYIGRERDKQRDLDRLLEIWIRRASPGRKLVHVKVPTFVLQAKDDPMTRVGQPEFDLLERAEALNPLFKYKLTEKGGHTGFVALDAPWFYSVVKNYFTYWGRWEMKKVSPFLYPTRRGPRFRTTEVSQDDALSPPSAQSFELNIPQV